MKSPLLNDSRPVYRSDIDRLLRKEYERLYREGWVGRDGYGHHVYFNVNGKSEAAVDVTSGEISTLGQLFKELYHDDDSAITGRYDTAGILFSMWKRFGDVGVDFNDVDRKELEEFFRSQHANA